MAPKLSSLCILAVVYGLSALVPIDANIFGNIRGSGTTKGKPTKDLSDVLLEEVVTESGVVVGFYELEPGLVLLKTNSTAKHLIGNNPHTSAYVRNKRSGKIGKTDVAALYMQLTGTKPSSRVAEALARVNDDGDEDTTGGRDLLTETPEEQDFDENGSSHTEDRKLKKSKPGKISDKDFKRSYCLDIYSAQCRTKMTDNFLFITPVLSYEFYQAVYTDKGNIRHTIYYRVCSFCDFEYVSYWIPEGWVIQDYLISSFPTLYGVEVDYVNGGDKFHVATYFD